MRGDGTIRHGGRAVTLRELEAVARKACETPVLRLDRDVPWCHVQWVVHALGRCEIAVEKGTGTVYRRVVAECEPWWCRSRDRAHLNGGPDREEWALGRMCTRSLRDVRARIEQVLAIAAPVILEFRARLRTPAIRCVRLQFAVMRSADLTYTVAEARALGVPRTERVPWVTSTLDAKLYCVQPTAAASRAASAPRTRRR